MSLSNENLLPSSDFSYWQSKKSYTQLMDEFINGTIDGQKFEEEFYRIWRSDRDKKYSTEELYILNLKINSEKLIESKGFSTIISNLFTDCDVFEPDPNLREDYEISEVELKNCVKKALLEIRYRYP
tara:strand:- start:239 stop:619 length:381 start_codon:yes stop_codon:yes gene_type:complete